MIKEYRKKTNLWIATGFLFPILVIYFAGELERILPEIVASYITLFSVFLGWLSYIVGCGYYAKAKGHHPLWGILGATGIGIVIIAFLPDKCVGQGEEQRIKTYRKMTNLMIALGLLLPTLAGVYYTELKSLFPGNAASYIILYSVLAGWILFIIGCVYYAKSKGRHPLWGSLGITGFGLLFLVILSDKSKAQE